MTYALPADRAVDWTLAGYPGGIPEVSTILYNLKDDFGAVGNGTTDDTAALKSAIASASWNANNPAVLYIPTGTYKITEQINLTSGMVLRGDGSNFTTLKFYLGTGVPSLQCIKTYGSISSYVSVTSGYTKGSTAITLSNATGFSGGDLIDIQETNNLSWWDGCYDESGIDGASTGWGANCKGEMATVTSKVGNTLYLDHPLFTTFDSGQSPVVARCTSVKQNIGLEYLKIERGDSYGAREPAAWGCNIWFSYGRKIWLKCVESNKPSQNHIMLNRVDQMEVRGSWFHDFWNPQPTGWSQGYGINPRWHVTRFKVEDNILNDLATYFMPQVGSCGCVYAYNYGGPKKTGIAAGTEFMDVHGFLAHHNLIEGNVGREMGCAGSWGPCPNNVFHRNKVGYQIYIYDRSNDCTITGNVIASGGKIQIAPFGGFTAPVTGTFQHGNKIGSNLYWDSGTVDHVLPDSYLYSSRPSWWSASLQWPAYGPDVTTGSLPAEIRYLAGTHVLQVGEPPNNGSGNVTLASPSGTGAGIHRVLGSGMTSSIPSPIGEGTGVATYFSEGSGSPTLSSPVGSGTGTWAKCSTTTITAYIDPDGGGVGSYVSMAAAVADNFGATSADLVANDETVQVWCRSSAGATDAGVATDITGFTTDSSHRIIIDAQTGYYNRGKWDASGKFYRMSPAAGYALTVNNDYVTIRNIMFGLTASANNQLCVYSNGANNLFEGCAFKAVSLGAFTGCSGLQMSNKASEVRFCISTDFLNNGYGFYKADAGGSLVTWLNCGVYNNTTGFRANAGDVAVINCLAIGNTTGFGGTFHATSVTNGSDDATAPGAGSIHSVPITTWKDAANYDFRLTSNSTLISNRGTRPAPSVYGPYYDADRKRLSTSDSSWDIGPYDFAGFSWVRVYMIPRKSHKEKLASQQLRRLRAVWAISKRKVYNG